MLLTTAPCHFWQYCHDRWKLQMAVTTKSECSCRSKSVWLRLLEGGICGHPSALTGSDSVQRGPNYCLTWLIVVSEECIPTEVPGKSLTALLKTYRPLLTSACCYVQRHRWSKATSGRMHWTQNSHDYRLKWGAWYGAFARTYAVIL